MGVSLLLVAISLSFLIVRIGAVAFELTGLPWDQAKFQALSAFSNSGFTTRESEAIVRHPVRRRIASWLIVLGNAGLITAMGSFASSLVVTDPLKGALNLGVSMAGVMALIWIGRTPRLTQRVREAARRWLVKHGHWDAMTEAELLRLDQGYALTHVKLTARSPAAHRRLAELKLKQNSVMLLAIERDHQFMPIPDGNVALLPGDELIVYGIANAVTRIFSDDTSQSIILVTEAREAYRPEGPPTAE